MKSEIILLWSFVPKKNSAWPNIWRGEKVKLKNHGHSVPCNWLLYVAGCKAVQGKYICWKSAEMRAAPRIGYYSGNWCSEIGSKMPDFIDPHQTSQKDNHIYTDMKFMSCKSASARVRYCSSDWCSRQPCAPSLTAEVHILKAAGCVHTEYASHGSLWIWTSGGVAWLSWVVSQTLIAEHFTFWDDFADLHGGARLQLIEMQTFLTQGLYIFMGWPQ